MSEVNGSVPLPPGMQVVNPLAEMLKQLLGEVEAGRVTSIAVIMVTPTGGVATPYLGERLGDLYVGSAMLQTRMLRQLEGQTPVPAGRPAILRPGMPG